MKRKQFDCQRPSAIWSSVIGSRVDPLHHEPAVAGQYADEPVLVINDMQGGFPASSDALTLFAIEEQIRLAKARNLGILVVEYDAHEMGETHEQLMRHLREYAKAIVVSKSADDGSAEIFEAVIDNGFWPENFIFCGVNSDSCVMKTIQGLIARVPACRITLLQDACNSDNGKDCPVWHKVFPQMKNVILRLHGC
jgi:hypothetical protein